MLLVDGAEHTAPLLPELRSRLRSSFSGEGRVVIAGRRRHELEWTADGWEHVAMRLALDLLPDQEAREMVMAPGVDDDADVARVLGWSGGLPLALAAGCDAVLLGSGGSSETPHDTPHDTAPRSLGDLVVDRLVRAEAGGRGAAAITARLAWRTTPGSVSQ